MAFIWTPGERSHYAIVTPEEKETYERTGDAPAWFQQADKTILKQHWQVSHPEPVAKRWRP